jgi:hypothetical protein
MKQTITSHLHSLNTKKTRTYNVENPDTGCGQAQHESILPKTV